MNTTLHLLNHQQRAAEIYPHLADLILHLRFVPDPANQTMGVTNSGAVHYNPEFVEGINSSNLVQSIYHEALHLFLDVFGRKESREHMKWNIAHDIEINHYARPSFGVFAATFNLPLCKSAEWYYEHLPTEEIACKCGQSQIKPEDLTEHTRRAIIRSAEQVVSGKHAGVDTGLLRQALRIINPTRTNGTLRKLQGAMLTNGLIDTSYERPNRRTGGHMPNIVLPAAMHREPRVICILDVSGSMNIHIEAATATVMSAVKSIGTSLQVVAWDTQPIAVNHVRRAADITKLKFSGGGTDMRAGILSAPQYGQFDAIFVVTDGETPWPTAEEVRKLPPIYVLMVTPTTAPSPMKTVQIC